MTVANLAESRSKFTIESNWMATRLSQPELAALTAEQLLGKTQRELIVPLRYGKSPQEVVLIGELPLRAQDEFEESDDLALEPQANCQRQLQSWLDGNAQTNPASPNPTQASPDLDSEDVDSVLTEAGYEWSHRDDSWIVAPNSNSPVELIVERVPRGLKVEGVLGDCRAYDSIKRTALAEYLCRAQVRIRFARAELDEQVRVVSEVDVSSLSRNLGHCIGSVAAACRVMLCEVRALTTPELSQVYLAYICLSPDQR